MIYKYRAWDKEDKEMLEDVCKTSNGPLTLADDLTDWNVTRDHIEVREASIRHEAWGTGYFDRLGYAAEERTKNRSKKWSECLKREEEWTKILRQRNRNKNREAHTSSSKECS